MLCSRLFPKKGVVFLYASYQAVMTNDQDWKKENLHNLILRTRSCGTGFITQSRARNTEIKRHRVRSCQAPQMPRLHTPEGCRLYYSVSVRLFFHFQCSDSGLALQLTCISVLKDSSINPDRLTAPMNHVKIFKGWPSRDAPSKLVQLWYKNFSPDHRGQVEMKKPTILINKTSTAWSCAEDQILENKILQNMILIICTEG